MLGVPKGWEKTMFSTHWTWYGQRHCREGINFNELFDPPILVRVFYFCHYKTNLRWKKTV